MGLPGRGTGAMQRIDLHKNYGLRPRPGLEIRLGVRGHSSYLLPLPASGRVTIPVEKFVVESDSQSSIYFDRADVLDKRLEKWRTDKVTFYENGRVWKPSKEIQDNAYYAYPREE
jgi:hypothetical protein